MLCGAPAAAGAFSIASWNVHNLSPAQPEAHFDRVAAVIAGALAAPDVVALQEVQDSDGKIDSSITDAGVTLGRLLAALARAGRDEYFAVEVAPTDDADGGEPGGNIRNVFLLRRDRVRLASGLAAGANPRRLAPEDPAFTDSRKPLAVALEVEGRRVVLINLHLRARLAREGGDAVGGGEQRTRQAGIVASFVAALTGTGAAAVIVLGDLNALPEEPPVAALESAALFDLTRLVPPELRFSYTFEGTRQLLDHVLVSAALRERVEAVAIVPLADGPGVASDHAPVHARIALGERAPVEAPAGGCALGGVRPGGWWCWLAAAAALLRRRPWRRGRGRRAARSTRR